MLRARDAAAARYGRERRRLYLASVALSLAAPVLPYLTGTWESAWYTLAATWLPGWVRAALFLVGFHLLFALLLAPLAYYSGLVLPRAFGLSRQTARAWLADWLKGTLLGVVLGALVGGVFLWSATSFEGWGWVAVFGLFLAASIVVVTFLMPYVLVPLFFKMRPLDDLAIVERVQALLARAGAQVRREHVCSLDFSRRTAEANAAVIGMGRSRRVVLADTLLQQFPPEEVDAVVAHELGHQVHGDIRQLLVVNLAVLWAGLLLGAWLAPAALPLLSLPSLAYVPGYPVLLAVAQVYLLLAAPLTNWWSRRLETAADRFALELTRNPAAFSGAMRRIAQQNLVEMVPPRWAEVLLGSHPALFRRIRLADDWQRV